MSSPALIPGDWLDKKQAAQYLGISIATMSRRMAARLIPSSLVNGKRLFERSVLDQMDRPDKAAVPVPVSSVSRLSASSVSRVIEPIPAPPQEQPITRQELRSLIEGLKVAQENPNRWTKLEDAARISGLSKRAIRKLIEDGKLRYFDDTFIKVRPFDLDDPELATVKGKRRRK